MALLDLTGGSVTVIPTSGPAGPAVRGADSTVPGPVGPASAVPGPQGQPGAGTTIQRVTMAGLSAGGTNLVDLGNGMCAPADPSNTDHAFKLLGICSDAAAPGDTITISTIGPVVGVSGAFGAGQLLFIAAGGGLTIVPPSAGWRQSVAVSTSTSSILYRPGQARLIPITPPMILPSYVDVIALVSGITPPGLPPRRGQFLAALEAYQPGAIALVRDNVDPDPASSSNLAWYHTVFVTPVCKLAALVQNATGLSISAIATIIANARSVSE